jgi:hypothetical protein
LKDFSFEPFCEAEQIDRSVNARFRRLNRIGLIMDWRSGTGEIVNLVNFDIQRKTYIMANKFEEGMIQYREKIFFTASEKIIYANHFCAIGQKPFAEVRA